MITYSSLVVTDARSAVTVALAVEELAEIVTPPALATPFEMVAVVPFLAKDTTDMVAVVRGVKPDFMFTAWNT